MKFVWRAEPFQFTTDPLTKFEPFTVSKNPVGLQNGVDGKELDGADRDEMTGAGPGGGLIVNRTTFDNSVVVVALVLEVADTAEPGIWTAT